MPHLRLSLLGPPVIDCDGIAITVDTRKSLALLIYLAVTGQSHRRDSLVNLLWAQIVAKQADGLFYVALCTPSGRSLKAAGLKRTGKP